MELQQLGRVLAVLVRAVSILGLLALTFGPAYAQPFIQVVYSDRWGASDAPRVLACYSAYIPLLAVNGEAFDSHAACGSAREQNAIWFFNFCCLLRIRH